MRVCNRTELMIVTLKTISIVFSGFSLFDLQDSEGEHSHDHELLLDAHVQTPQAGKWQHEQDKIQQNVENGRHPSLNMDVVAFSLLCVVNPLPRVGCWPTLKCCGNSEGNTVGDDQAHHTIANTAELGIREDAKDEEEQRHLDR